MTSKSGKISQAQNQVDAGSRSLAMSRRQMLHCTSAMGLAAVVPACGSDESTPPDSAASDGGTDSNSTLAWAVGGTDLISVDYPPDDIFADAASCTLALSTALTEGPCYYADDAGEDISAGRTGLPMQLCLRLLDADCNPLSDHLVEIWHSDTRGFYSGDTSESADASRFGVIDGRDFGSDFCTGGDADAEASVFYRGQLTSDSSGRVNFKSCFPGWYAGRTLHIHVAVSDHSGARRIVSQLCFSDAFVTEITTAHELYMSRGDQDTPLAAGTDMFFPQADFEQYLLTTRQNSDGTLLAYHSIIVA